jgi:DNA repair exonuclease SbcCD ATPase subunit
VREKTASELTNAKTDFARLETIAQGHEEEIAKAKQDSSRAASDLANTAQDLEWTDVLSALQTGRDPAPLIARRIRDLQDEDAQTQREIGGQKARIEQIEKDITLARVLHDQEKALRETASLSRDLASLLRTNNFPTFIREQALRALAEDGSRRLNEVSKGRFDFEVYGQDFHVLDRWNGGERRSVNTLSGGETFLASLALALALAEQLPGLAGDTTSGALETLFIDEGFSHLDNETLDDVASALEVLGQDRRRLVGVITHLPALAERMPARITVHKSPAGSTVTVE